MKTKSLKIVILVFAFSFVLAACKKEEETKTNSFKYNDKEAMIGTVLGLEFGESGIAGVYGINMEFFEKTLIVKYTNSYPDSLVGKGDALIITFLTNNESEIASGVYNFVASDEPFKAFGISGEGESFLLINLDSENETQGAEMEITGGKVTVKKSADEYEFTFDLKTDVNSNITGYYKGKPVIYSDYKKKSDKKQNWITIPELNR